MTGWSRGQSRVAGSRLVYVGDDEIRAALRSLGSRRARAKAALDRLTSESKVAVVKAREAGLTEQELADLFAVDRMTIRSWQGKPRSSKM